MRRSISTADSNRVHDSQSQLRTFIICRRNRLQHLAAGIGQVKVISTVDWHRYTTGSYPNSLIKRPVTNSLMDVDVELWYIYIYIYIVANRTDRKHHAYEKDLRHDEIEGSDCCLCGCIRIISYRPSSTVQVRRYRGQWHWMMLAQCTQYYEHWV